MLGGMRAVAVTIVLCAAVSACGSSTPPPAPVPSTAITQAQFDSISTGITVAQLRAALPDKKPVADVKQPQASFECLEYDQIGASANGYSFCFANGKLFRKSAF